MKYFSEILHKFFESEEECVQAESDYRNKEEVAKKEKEQKTAERKARAKEVEAAYAEMQAAQKKFDEVLAAFVADFGSFHMTISSPFYNSFPFNKLFDEFFNRF